MFGFGFGLIKHTIVQSEGRWRDQDKEIEILQYDGVEGDLLS